MESIAARADSPAWLEAEYAATRAGLIQLRQNVVLLRHADSPDLFYPVLPRCVLPWNILSSLCTCSTKGTLLSTTWSTVCICSTIAPTVLHH